MTYLVETVVAFGLFDRGEKLLVSQEFLDRFGRWLNVLEPPADTFFEEDEPADEVLAAFDAAEKGLTKEPTDGEGDHLPRTG